MRPANPPKTTITGVVLDNSNVPIPGVTVRAVLTNVLHANGTPHAVAAVQTDAQGQFIVPAGARRLREADGRWLDGARCPGRIPALEYDMVTVAGQNNTVGQPIFLLPLNTANSCASPTRPAAGR